MCRGSARAPWVDFTELAFERCIECGTVFKTRERADVRPEDFYEQGYFHGRKSGRDRRFEHRVRKAMGQLRGAMEFGQVRSVLDVGCSFGYIIEAGRRLGLSSAGADVSAYAVERCRERGLRAQVGTLDALPFSDGEFDLVILRHVLEHTADPSGALAEVRRVLSPNGLVLIAVPDLRYWKGLLLRRTYRYFRPDDLGQQHYVYYTDQSLPRLLEANGWDLMATSKAFGRPRTAASSAAHALWDRVRHAGIALWQGTARLLHMRRELYMIARKRPARPEQKSPEIPTASAQDGARAAR